MGERGPVKGSAVCLPVLTRLVVLELVPDHAHHDVVRDEPTSIHDLFSLDAERRLLRDLLAQHIARSEVADAELFTYTRRLCALACIRTRPTPHKQGQERACINQQRAARSRKSKTRAGTRAAARTCAWGPDEDGAELLCWRRRRLL